MLFRSLCHDDASAVEYNYFTGIIPKRSDYFFVWGNLMKEYCKTANLNWSEIKISGNPYFDNLVKCDDREFKSSYILLAVQGPSNFSLFGLHNALIEKYVDVIKQICIIVKKLNKKLIIKLHPDPYEFDVSK